MTLNSSTFGHEKAKPEIGLKYIFITPPKEWQPTHGGALSIEYAVAKYFSLAGELRIRGLSFIISDPEGEGRTLGKALDLSLALVPKLLIPIEFENATLVPYLGFTASISPMNLVNNKNSLGLGMGAMIGMKYYFTQNWGINWDLGASIDFRNTEPAYIGAGGLQTSLGFLYSF